jgi:hypothetical protein
MPTDKGDRNMALLDELKGKAGEAEIRQTA